MEWNSLERLFSASKSLLEYGSSKRGIIKTTATMMSAKSKHLLRSINGSIGRVDNITPQDQQHGQKFKRPGRSSQTFPPPKRQKQNQPGWRNESSSMPFSDQQPVTPDTGSRTEIPASQSTTSTPDGALHGYGVPEFRAAHNYTENHSGNGNRRHRRHQAKLPAYSPGNRHQPTRPNGTSESADRVVEAISDASDPAEHRTIVSSTKRPRANSSHTDRHSTRDSADVLIGRPPQKRQALSGQHAHAPSTLFKVQANKMRRQGAREDIDEPDELSTATIHPPRSPVTRLTVANTTQQMPKSASISHRADIRPSNLSKRQATLSGEASLRLKAAVRQPNLSYTSDPAAASSVPIYQHVLKQLQEAGKPPCLVLHDLDGNQDDERPWLRIDSGTLKKVLHSSASSSVLINQARDLANCGGPAILLEFFSPEDAARFVKWCSERTSQEACHIERLERSRMEAATEKLSAEIAEYELSHRQRKSVRSEKTKLEKPMLLEPIDPEENLTETPSAVYELSASTTGPARSGPRISGYTPAVRRSSRKLSSLDRLDSTLAEPERWTDKNTDWATEWRMSLWRTFPDYGRTTVDKDDIMRLDEGQCLNDNIIGFYLGYLLEGLKDRQPEVAKRIYFHNTYFYDKLKPIKGRNINYDSVKKWTSKVDIFSYDYIVVPVNEHYHWWVAIICNAGKMDPAVVSDASSVEEPVVIAIDPATQPGKSETKAMGESTVPVIDVESRRTSEELGELSQLSLRSPDSTLEGTTVADDEVKTLENVVDLRDDEILERTNTSPRKSKKVRRKTSGPSPRKYHPEDPRIITLDSLGTTHYPVCAHLRDYLIAEFKEKKDKEIQYNQSLGMKATGIPEQNNFCDCGVYLLGYIEEFVKDPDKFVHDILQRQRKQWEFDAPATRTRLRELILDLHRVYQSEEEQKQRHKKLAKQHKAQSTAGRLMNAAKSVPASAKAEEQQNCFNASSRSPKADHHSPELSAGVQGPKPVDEGESGPEEMALTPATDGETTRVDNDQLPAQQDQGDSPPRTAATTELLPSIESQDRTKSVSAQNEATLLQTLPDSPAHKDESRLTPKSKVFDDDDDDVQLLQPLPDSSPANRIPLDEPTREPVRQAFYVNSRFWLPDDGKIEGQKSTENSSAEKNLASRSGNGEKMERHRRMALEHSPHFKGSEDAVFVGEPPAARTKMATYSRKGWKNKSKKPIDLTED